MCNVSDFVCKKELLCYLFSLFLLALKQRHKRAHVGFKGLKMENDKKITFLNCIFFFLYIKFILFIFYHFFYLFDLFFVFCSHFRFKFCCVSLKGDQPRLTTVLEEAFSRFYSRNGSLNPVTVSSQRRVESASSSPPSFIFMHGTGRDSSASSLRGLCASFVGRDQNASN